MFIGSSPSCFSRPFENTTYTALRPAELGRTCFSCNAPCSSLRFRRAPKGGHRYSREVRILPVYSAKYWQACLLLTRKRSFSLAKGTVITRKRSPIVYSGRFYRQEGYPVQYVCLLLQHTSSSLQSSLQLQACSFATCMFGSSASVLSGQSKDATTTCPEVC